MKNGYNFYYYHTKIILRTNTYNLKKSSHTSVIGWHAKTSVNSTNFSYCMTIIIHWLNINSIIVLVHWIKFNLILNMCSLETSKLVALFPFLNIKYVFVNMCLTMQSMLLWKKLVQSIFKKTHNINFLYNVHCSHWIFQAFSHGLKDLKSKHNTYHTVIFQTETATAFKTTVYLMLN